MITFRRLFVGKLEFDGHSFFLGQRMDKDKKKTSITINTIKNKQARERLWQQIKHKKKLEKKKRKVEKEKKRKELGEEAVPKEVSVSFL